MSEQPSPIPNDRLHIADLVEQAVRDRKQLGIQRYGVPLQAFNGRDSLQDAFEEAIDLSLYLKQWQQERLVLFYWLKSLFEARDRHDYAAESEVVEELRSLYQQLGGDKKNADN